MGNKRTKLNTERRDWKVFLSAERDAEQDRDRKTEEQWWRVKYIYSSAVLSTI